MVWLVFSCPLPSGACGPTKLGCQTARREACALPTRLPQNHAALSIGCDVDVTGDARHGQAAIEVAALVRRQRLLHLSQRLRPGEVEEAAQPQQLRAGTTGFSGLRGRARSTPPFAHLCVRSAKDGEEVKLAGRRHVQAQRLPLRVQPRLRHSRRLSDRGTRRTQCTHAARALFTPMCASHSCAPAKSSASRLMTACGAKARARRSGRSAGRQEAHAGVLRTGARQRGKGDVQQHGQLCLTPHGVHAQLRGRGRPEHAGAAPVRRQEDAPSSCFARSKSRAAPWRAGRPAAAPR